MSAIIDIIVPVFGMVLVGWVIGRSKLLSPEGLRGFTGVTFYDGQGMMVRAGEFGSIDEMENTAVCVLSGTTTSGAGLQMPACLVVTVSEGKIIELREYLDTAQAAVLMQG